jgi:hypothetical protein
MDFPQLKILTFTPRQNEGKNNSFEYFNVQVSDGIWKDKTFLTEWRHWFHWLFEVSGMSVYTRDSLVLNIDLLSLYPY